jgi:hypothetical protein
MVKLAEKRCSFVSNLDLGWRAIAGELSVGPSQPVQAANPAAGSKAGQRGVATA